MGLKDVLLNVVTIGGHGRLQDAVKIYEHHYAIYDRLFQQAKGFETRTNQELEAMGKTTIQAFETLQLSLRILQIPVSNRAVNRQQLTAQKTDYNLNRTQKLLNDFSASTATVQGAGLGASAAVGSWAMVGLLGSASTGTAIATLSGAAATNATLAWFGGGALAAGGGGMAAGMVTIGGIIALPLIAFSAWTTHSKASEVEQHTIGITQAIEQLEPMIEPIKQRYHLVQDNHKRLKHAHNQLERVFLRVKKQLFPIFVFSHLARLIRGIFGHGYYLSSEQPQLDQLNDAVQEFSALFSPLVSPAVAEQPSSIAPPLKIAVTSAIAQPAVEPATTLSLAKSPINIATDTAVVKPPAVDQKNNTLDENNPATSAQAMSQLSGVVSLYQAPDLSALHSAIGQARQQLAELESKYTQTQYAIDSIQAALFSKLQQLYRRFDEISLIVQYRQRFIDLFLGKQQHRAEEVKSEFEQEQQRQQEAFDKAAQAAQDRQDLSQDDQKTLQKLWRKLVRLYHPDRYTHEPEKQQAYQNLTALINQARDAGDIATLQQIADDPEGFMRKQGWLALDFSDDFDAESLQKLLAALQQQIAELTQQLNELQSSSDYELYVLSQKQPELLELRAQDVAAKLQQDIERLDSEAQQLAEQIVELTGQPSAI